MCNLLPKYFVSRYNKKCCIPTIIYIYIFKFVYTITTLTETITDMLKYSYFVAEDVF